jgi:hypothetical protein
MTASANKPKKAKTAGRAKLPSVVAFHEEGDGGHIVGIGHLRVMLCNDGGYWVAQGLEIDYAATGKTQKDAKKNFEDGLAATIDQHLQIYENIEKILIPAPVEVWREFIPKSRELRFSQVSFHQTEKGRLSEIPYSGIDWFEEAGVAA